MHPTCDPFAACFIGASMPMMVVVVAGIPFPISDFPSKNPKGVEIISEAEAIQRKGLKIARKLKKPRRKWRGLE